MLLLFANIRCSLLLLAVPALAIGSARGQLAHGGPDKAIALAATVPPYDVVSIRPHNPALDPPNSQSFSMNIHDNVLTASNVPLEMLIEFAYDVKSDMIFGLSGPVSSAHFDIEAKALPPDGGAALKLTDRQLVVMIIPLLADRFHLKVHLEQKIMPVYDLVVVRGGPKLKLSQAERTDSSWNINAENTSKILTSKSANMADLAAALADEVHREVIDKTGLTGSADITLKWSDDVAAEAGGPNVVSIFTAVEEQLGLKLQPSRGPVDTLVIDHVEMPSEN
jgi:bla regulator protein BlaR1